jgi:hypothetical protein
VPLRSARDADRIRQTIAAGLFASAARLRPDGATFELLGEESGEGERMPLSVHPESALFRGRLPSLVVFGEAVRTGDKCFIRFLTPVSPAELAAAAPTLYHSK